MINKQKPKILNNLFFFLAYIPVFILAFLRTSMFVQYIPNIYVQVVIIFTVFLIGYKLIVLDQLTRKEYLYYMMILALVLVSYHYSGNNALLILMFFLFGARNIDQRLLILVYLIIGLALLIYIYYSTTISRIPDLTYARAAGASVRHSFGIIYPTDFASHIFYLCCAYLCLRGRKFNLLDLGLLLVISFFVDKFTDARLNTLLILILGFGGIIIKYDWVKKVIRRLWLLPIFSFIFVFLTTYFYTPASEILVKLNSALSGRLSLVYNILATDGIKLFGQKIVEHGWGGDVLITAITQYSFIDSAYLRLLIIYGAVSTAMFLCISVILLKTEKKSIMLLICMLIFASGIVEQHFLDIAYNPFFILLITDYFKEKEKEKNK